MGSILFFCFVLFFLCFKYYLFLSSQKRNLNDSIFFVRFFLFLFLFFFFTLVAAYSLKAGLMLASSAVTDIRLSVGSSWRSFVALDQLWFLFFIFVYTCKFVVFPDINCFSYFSWKQQQNNRHWWSIFLYNSVGLAAICNVLRFPSTLYLYSFRGVGRREKRQRLLLFLTCSFLCATLFFLLF